MKYNSVRLVVALVILFVLTSNATWSQKITASDSTGCAPFVGVVFTGLPGAININWDFGDGSSSTINKPSHTFALPGSYTVKYTATVSGSPVSQTIPIKVFGKPTPKFTTPSLKIGCAPLTVKFQDQSIGSGGSTIAKWNWSFGDGNVSTSGSPTHVYNIPGHFDVSLIVTDANGCDSSTVLTKYITVSKKPLLVVSPSSPTITACQAPLTIPFNGTGTTGYSPTSTALTYSWTFGNGSSSNVGTPPAVTYISNGTYSVKYTVTDNIGCTDSLIKKVVINKPTASMLVKDTVCKGVLVLFSNISSAGSILWKYGDGVSDTTGKHIYPTTGVYSVTLTVTSGNCSDDTVKKIVVEESIAKFTSSPNYFCGLPGVLSFKDQSTNAASWKWTFGATNAQFVSVPSTSTIQNPTITITNKDTNQYSIYKPEYASVTLEVTSKHGCKHSVTVSTKDTINLPNALFMPDTTQGCVPLTVHFSDSSISKEKIVNWKYIFGDGSSLSGTNPDPAHTYTAAGTYYVKLIIQNAKGCIDTSHVVKIKVGKLPTPDFSAAPLSVCPGGSVNFTDLTPASDSVDTWHYATDAGFMMSACPGTANPSWVFGSTTGAQNVTLTVGSKGCYASITKSAYITVKGPIAQLTTSTDCSSSRVYTFQAMVQDANHWTWDFGDGTTVANSTTTTISHTYSVSGNFVAKLTASNNTSGCAPSIDSAKVYVRKIKATLLSPDTLFCSGKSISFNASPSTDVDPQCNSGYYWIWGDDKGPGIYGSPTASHIYLKPGKYDLKLIVKDINNCWDTLVRPVRASGVTPKFVSNVKYGCLPLSVNFTDQSVSDTTIVAWSWNFGDGGNGTTQNPTHLFTATAPKTFTVTETVTNKLGCMAQYTSTITPSRPDTGFSASKTTLCTGDSVKFTPTTLNHKGYSWNFGDGTAVSTATSPYHVFKKPGAFAVSLEVSDSIGCKGTKTIVNYITVQGVPNVGFYSTADSVGAKNCYPLLVQFKDTSIANIFQSRIWDLGNGTQVVPNTQVGTTYQLPGTYTVSLSVTTTFGCSSKLTKSIKVNGPVGDFTLTPTTICKGSSVTLGVKDTARVFTYHWDFGDGYDAGKASPVTHVFNHHPVGGQAQITLVYWSADSSCKKAVTHNLKIHQVTAEFKRNGEAVKSDTVHCLGVQDVFTNNSQSASTWLWNFGDGNTSTVNNPTYTYTAAGTYSVSLNIKDNTLGCVDTLVKKMYINQLPVVSATGGEKCEDKLLQLSATGGVTYNWLPLKNLNSSNIPNPVVDTLLKVNTNYTVVATDANGCTGVGVAPVLINHRPKSIKWDTTIVIGQTIAIDTAYQGTNYTYVWSPADSLSCTTCGIPTIKPLVNKDFTVSISDKKGCFPSINSYIKIVVDPKSSLDVPTAFSPNGDGVNDVVYVDGWGIKKLLEFKIYNRWGELLFTSNDLKTGWDGKYNGVVQNIDSYAYTVIAETYVDKQPLTKKGYIKIIK